MTASRNYADSHPVLPVSTKRFEASPFLALYATEDVTFAVYGGRLYPLSLWDDVIASYWHLRRKAALFDVPERPVLVEGPDAERLLDAVLTRDVGRLAPGRAMYAIACNERGGILMDGVLLRLAPDRFWYVLADGGFLGWLHALARGLDVTIDDPQSWTLQVQGPTALLVLGEACDGRAPDPFAYFAVAEARIGGEEVIVSRTGWSGELGFELYTLPGSDATAIWEALLEAGRPHGLAVQGLDSLGIRRIDAGILDNGTDMDSTTTPLEAGLGRFVDLRKPSFIGREALRGADRGALLFGASSPDAMPVPGDEVRQGDAVVGRVSAGAWSPYLDCGIGYVRLISHGAWEGAEVRLGEERSPARLVALPFYDREKRIPRGLPS